MNKLTFISEVQEKTKDGHKKWLCQCDCGDKSIYTATRVRHNRVNQCKKCTIKIVSQKKKTHGMRESKEYSTWVSLKNRCLRKSSKDYERYGKKGITVYLPWINNFQMFFDHIGLSPSNNHSIDRIDNTKGYEPGNVRWATRSEQQRNKSNTVYVTNGKETKHINDVAESLGISRGAAHLRLKRGKLNEFTRC
jgi:hypothetical protein